jgi:RimJ/RimL family protein N-acetyltransferase
MKERNYEQLTFRMMSYIDLDEFKRACLASPEELTAFLSKGEFMEYYNVVDYMNLFNAMLKDPETNVYALFEGTTLVGVGTSSPANRSFGSQLIYWIRNGFHGKGYGLYFMYNLISRAINNGADYAELIIDRENIPSIKVAETLGLTKIKEWDRPDSGQGERNSGKFVLYFAYDHALEVAAERLGVEPFILIQDLWFREASGQLEAPKMTIRRNQFGGNRLSQNLRLASFEDKKDKKNPEKPS